MRPSIEWRLIFLLLALALPGATQPCRAADLVAEAIAKIDPTPDLRPAQGLFLVARRGLPDPNFRRAVVFLLRHGDAGTLGLIVNRQSHVSLAEAIPQVAGVGGAAQRLALGGPVGGDRVLFVLRSRESVERGVHVIDDVYFSPDQDLLEELLQAGKGEAELKVFAGHSGWAASQLAAEIARGDWHLARIDTQNVFAIDGAQLWQRLIERFEPKGTLVFSSVEPIPLL